MENLTKIEFRLEGILNSNQISPETLDIKDFADYFNDVSQFILSDKNIPKKRQPILVSYEEGSAKLVISIATIFAIHIQADIQQLSKTNKLEISNSKRAGIIEKWQLRAHANNTLDYSISFLDKEELKIKIDKNSNFIKIENEDWFNAELYLYGEIKEWGGVSKTNIHIDTKQYGTVIVDIPSQVLRNEAQNRVYKNNVILVSAKQNVLSGEIKDVKFKDFIEYSPGFNENELNRFIDKGKDIWKDSGDPSEWVRNLRGEL